jgi:hypothetical protein
MDPVVESVIQTKSVLQDKTWQLTDYQVTVKNTDIPPPLLIPRSDSLIQAGNYHLDDMLPGDTDFPEYFLQFTDENEILSDTANSGNFIGLGGKYFVRNNVQIRIIPPGVKPLLYEYYYNPGNNTMTFTLSEEDASKAIEDATNRLINDAIKERPDKIGEGISGILHNSPVIKKLIKEWIKQAIAGKLPGVFDYNIERNTQELSEKLRAHFLDSINWRNVLKDAVKHELDKIHNLKADSLTPVITTEIADQIGVELAVEPIYDAILPFTATLDQDDSDSKAEKIATLIVKILEDIFSEENLEKIIEPIWDKFTKLSPAQIDSIALQLTEITQEQWFNVDTLSQVFLPITEKIDDTPVSQLGELAQEATDSLEVFVDKLNSRFPGLGLDPDYDNIESIIQSILVAAKPVIGIQGPEKVADEIAQVLITEVFNTENIESTFVAALDYLQTIDPSVAAETIATWIVNLEQKIEPELIEWLTEKLGPILDNQNHKLTSFRIGNKVNEYSLANFGFGTIKELVLKELNATVDVNLKELAKHIAKVLIERGLIKNGIEIEQLAEKIRPELEDDGGENPIGDKIRDAMEANDFIGSGPPPDLIGKIISFLLYKEAWDEFKIANNFKDATIILKHE